MMRSRRLGLVSTTAVLVVALTFSDGLQAQPAGFKTTPLLQSTFGSDPSKEAVVLSVELAPGASTGRHTHPGDCYGTVFEGTLELHVEGREPRWVTVGQAYHNPGGTVHEFRNVGDKPARLVNTMVVEKGKPRMQPVPR